MDRHDVTVILTFDRPYLSVSFLNASDVYAIFEDILPIVQTLIHEVFQYYKIVASPCSAVMYQR